MRIGVGADHGGFELKQDLVQRLRAAGHEITDFGARSLDRQDDYPDFAIPVARAVASGTLDRGILVCGSGVGACIAANKITGARACLCHDPFSAHQGVEDDDMNVLCLGARIIGSELAWELTRTFLQAQFSGAERHRRRLGKITQLETK